MITGRCAPCSRSAIAAIACADGSGVGKAGSGGWLGSSASGGLGLDVDRQLEHHRAALDHRALVGALGVVGGGGGALDAVGGRAHRLGQARWSMRKLEVSAAAGASPASTSSGVRLLTASVSPVTVLVSPGPWCTLQMPTLPLTRAYPSAMQIAPSSRRAG